MVFVALSFLTHSHGLFAWQRRFFLSSARFSARTQAGAFVDESLEIAQKNSQRAVAEGFFQKGEGSRGFPKRKRQNKRNDGVESDFQEGEGVLSNRKAGIDNGSGK